LARPQPRPLLAWWAKRASGKTRELRPRDDAAQGFSVTGVRLEKSPVRLAGRRRRGRLALLLLALQVLENRLDDEVVRRTVSFLGDLEQSLHRFLRQLRLGDRD